MSADETKSGESERKQWRERTAHSIEEATFRDLPLCLVRLWIYITDFEFKIVKVDMANYRESRPIMVKSSGPPVAT